MAVKPIQNNSEEHSFPPHHTPPLWVLACVWLIKGAVLSPYDPLMLCRGARSLLTHLQTKAPLGENEI